MKAGPERATILASEKRTARNGGVSSSAGGPQKKTTRRRRVGLQNKHLGIPGGVTRTYQPRFRRSVAPSARKPEGEEELDYQANILASQEA
ncbi:hypothetical protein NDU88_009551 [Pleurodeles waltl]|uniref:Uncharacterized protein n=1 Tax=Pleurodeles waltl TaxID=8319 RepID=A0AAV7P4A6_PLEWA|nr:hypothetical protein NDU88_009551 [Pleurodeles waltl]